MNHMQNVKEYPVHIWVWISDSKVESETTFRDQTSKHFWHQEFAIQVI